MKTALTLIFIFLISLRGVEAQPSPPAQALVFTHVTILPAPIPTTRIASPASVCTMS